MRCVLSVVVFLATSVIAIRREDLYSFGEDHGDTTLPVGDDLSSAEFQLQVPIAYYEQMHSSIFVSVSMFFSSLASTLSLYQICRHRLDFRRSMFKSCHYVYCY